MAAAWPVQQCLSCAAASSGTLDLYGDFGLLHLSFLASFRACYRCPVLNWSAYSVARFVGQVSPSDKVVFQELAVKLEFPIASSLL